jgi:polyhydroxybutyrate depolymerase
MRFLWLWLLLGSVSTILLCLLLAVGLIALRHYSEMRNLITAIEPLPVGSSTHGITIDGRQRTYIVYRPAGLTGSAPLVVMLHGGFGSASQAQRGYGWDAEADSGHFLVAYPNGVTRSWNTGGGCCGKAAADSVDDVGFISAMVRQISLEANVDQSRIYATGISNGGIMAYTLACQTSLFAAIGPDSATELGKCPTPHPVSVIHIHGTADTRIRYTGGEGDGTAHIDGPAVPTVNSDWRTIDGCSAPGVTTRGVVTTSIAQCPAGRTVELITIQGAGHQWPGVKTNALIRKLVGTDASSTALDATSTIWRFFSQHHK